MSEPWTRKEVIGDATLYLGDCRDILPTLDVTHAIVSDPPYGIGYILGAGGRRGGADSGSYRRNSGAPIVGDDAPFDPTFLIDKADEVVLWGADHFYPRLPSHGRWLAWDKLAGCTLRDSFCDVEFAWHSADGAARIFSHLWKGLSQDSEKGQRRQHPTQKPVALMEWCIEQLRYPCREVTDPFMGSGTTGVAAIRKGLAFTGMEIDPKHFDIACRRIEEAYKQPRLFDEPPPKPKQGSIFDGEAA